jgi:8-oxo-dGTP pyrophosphatase MutT (NUDIX family)
MRQRMVNQALGDLPASASMLWPSVPPRRGEPARRIRRAARILLVDGAGRVLLFRFTPSDRPPLWATPGGECDEGESFDAAARRELLEETGIDTDPGPEVARGGSDFLTFDGEPVTGDERYSSCASPIPRSTPMP